MKNSDPVTGAQPLGDGVWQTYNSSLGAYKIYLKKGNCTDPGRIYSGINVVRNITGYYKTYYINGEVYTNVWETIELINTSVPATDFIVVANIGANKVVDFTISAKPYISLGSRTIQDLSHKVYYSTDNRDGLSLDVQLDSDGKSSTGSAYADLYWNETQVLNVRMEDQSLIKYAGQTVFECTIYADKKSHFDNRDYTQTFGNGQPWEKIQFQSPTEVRLL